MIDMDIKKHKQKELVACRKTYLITHLHAATGNSLRTTTTGCLPATAAISQTFLVTEHFVFTDTYVLWSLISHIKVSVTISVGSQTKGFLKNYYMNSTLNYHQIC
jgi:hypothetical protein